MSDFIDTIFLVIILGGALAITGLFVYAVFRLLDTPAFRARVRKLTDALGLSRAPQNPVLRQGPYEWERESVMNPAAVETGGKTHLFYRAVGSDGVSRIGYAASKDGEHFDERLPYPVFALDTPVMDRDYLAKNHPQLLASGGSWAGVEDPRAALIDGRVYLTFNAFGGWDSLRIGVSSISVDDLVHQRWNWSRPTFLSKQGEVHKSWVLFPEKIAGKFAVLHGFSRANRDHANIAYLDSLDRDPVPYIESDSGFRDVSTEESWDTKVRGAGPPPVKTSKGWLLFYHANDAAEPHRYKLGALLLDLLDPSRVIARSSVPVLAPDASYENEGKPGIVYACGATASNDTLRVYYGGADAVVCTATAKLSEFLDALVHGGRTPALAYAPA